MRCKWPVFKRCCLCLPLRIGILGIAYLKLAVDLFISIIIIMNLAYRSYYYKWYTVLSCMMAIFFILNTIFHFLIIIGGHMENYKLMRIFFRCAIFMLALDILLPLACTILTVVCTYIYKLMFITSFEFLLLLFCLNVLLHIYLTALVRSDMLKLKNNLEYEFTNRTETLREIKSELQEV